MSHTADLPVLQTVAGLCAPAKQHLQLDMGPQAHVGEHVCAGDGLVGAVQLLQRPDDGLPVGRQASMSLLLRGMQ